MMEDTGWSNKTSHEATKNTILPPLSECITKIKKLSLTSYQLSIEADVYSSMLAFLCHLKNDQATIFHAQR